MDTGDRGGLRALLVAKVVCCGGLLLVVSGGLGGLGAWLLEDGLVWLVLGFVVAAAGVGSWRRATHRRRQERAGGEAGVHAPETGTSEPALLGRGRSRR